jgi:hypothetical protein
MESVKDLLERRGYRWKRVGDKWVTNSPFKPGGDSTPSFYLYPSGWYKCYSTGKSGTAATLARYLGESLVGLPQWVSLPSKPKLALNGYIPQQFTNLTIEELGRVHKYAESRRIFRAYIPGVWLLYGQRRPALIFPHVDTAMTIIGAKFRIIDGTKNDRMRTLGRIGFYFLDARLPNIPTVMYLIESETSANSLWEYLLQQKRSAIVISCGGVGMVPRKLPFNYPLRKIIDYDGDPELYHSRIARYDHLGGENVKLELKKNEDINELWKKNQMYKIDFLL